MLPCFWWWLKLNQAKAADGSPPQGEQPEGTRRTKTDPEEEEEQEEEDWPVPVHAGRKTVRIKKKTQLVCLLMDAMLVWNWSKFTETQTQKKPQQEKTRLPDKSCRFIFSFYVKMTSFFILFYFNLQLNIKPQRTSDFTQFLTTFISFCQD